MKHPSGCFFYRLFFGIKSLLEGLILAQSERWRRGLGMQVERSRKDELLELLEVPTKVGMEERDRREFFGIAANG